MFLASAGDPTSKAGDSPGNAAGNATATDAYDADMNLMRLVMSQHFLHAKINLPSIVCHSKWRRISGIPTLMLLQEGSAHLKTGNCLYRLNRASRAIRYGACAGILVD